MGDQPKILDIDAIMAHQHVFIRERDWEKYHTPKNLSMALAGEAGELCEIFQWLTEQESFELKAGHTKHQEVCDELADVMFYLIRIADILKIDLNQAIWQKMAKNAVKYPAALARGNAKKYTEF